MLSATVVAADPGAVVGAGEEGPPGRSVDAARDDDVGVHAAVLDLPRQCPDPRMERGLGRRVRRRSGHRLLGEQRRDVHQVAAAFEVGEDRGRRRDRRQDVAAVEVQVQIGRHDARRPARLERPDEVHEPVEPAEAVDGLRRGGRRLARLQHVAGAERHVGRRAEPEAEVAKAGFVAPTQQHLVATRQQMPRDVLTEVAGRARDQERAVSLELASLTHWCTIDTGRRSFTARAWCTSEPSAP